VTDPRVGRILTGDERAARMANETAATIRGEGLRSAFTISKEHILTAWHCVRDVPGPDLLWFRLQDADVLAGRRYQYLPVRVLEQDEAFDVAVLELDRSRLSEIGLLESEAESLMAGSVIPLGTDVSKDERVSVMGFPVTSPSANGDTLGARVDAVTQPIGDATALKLFVDEFSTSAPADPRGLSGGPILKLRGVGLEVAVGIVRSFPVGKPGGASIGGGLFATRVEDVAGRLPHVGAALSVAPSARTVKHPVGQLIGDLDGPLALGVHKAIDVGATDLPELPEYVPRAHDARLQQIVEDVGQASKMVVLVGESSTGKTRALWEALLQLPPQWRLWRPVDARALNVHLSAGDISPRTVLWLDDAHNYLDRQLSDLAEDNAARLRERVSEGEGPVLVLATLWPVNWQQLTAEPLVGQGARAQATKLLENTTYIQVPSFFEGDGLATINAAAGRDPRISLALQHATPGRITQYLAGALKLRERYATAPAEGRAVIEAAMDARRLGHENRLPEAFLVDAAAGYISDETWYQLIDGWPAQVLRGLCADWRGLPGPLARIRPRPGEPASNGQFYRLADVLEEEGARKRHHIAPPGQFWIAAAHHSGRDDLEMIGSAAESRGRYRDAATLYLRAAAAGHTSGLESLAKRRQHAGDQAESEQLLRLAADFGSASAAEDLVELRERAGAYAEAEWLAARTAEAGSTGALVKLMESREAAGKYADAERLAVLAGEAGWQGAPRKLMEFRERAGAHAEAEELAVRADSTGTPAKLMGRAEWKRGGTGAELSAFRTGGSALVGLMRLREAAGMYADAERIAIQTGSTSALVKLMELREVAGKHDDAERLATQAAAAGDIDGLEILAVMRQAPAGKLSPGGDPRRRPQPFVVGVIPAAAERIYRLAAAAGSVRAQRIIAVLEERAGNHADAERLALQAAEKGNYIALNELILLREKRKENPDAERLAVLAADVGDTAPLLRLMKRREQEGKHANAERLALQINDISDSIAESKRISGQATGNALVVLAELREQAGDPAGAERLLRLAANSGRAGPLVTLMEFQERKGEHAEAERLANQATEAGWPNALLELAELREKRGEHREAERLAAKAVDAGLLSALIVLAELLEKRGEHSEAERLAAKAARAGNTSELVKLARARERAGKYAQGERLAAAAGASAAPLIGEMAAQRERVGKHAEAERLAVEAAAAGWAWALFDLVEAWEHDGKHIEADRLAIRTIDVSSFTEGLKRLTALREQVGDYSGAERLYRIAIDTGLVQYLPSLARLWKMAGDEVGAEQLLRFGLDANGAIASAWCIQDINP
jgi:Trypsin-like peptidase domain